MLDFHFPKPTFPTFFEKSRFKIGNVGFKIGNVGLLVLELEMLILESGNVGFKNQKFWDGGR